MANKRTTKTVVRMVTYAQFQESMSAYAMADAEACKIAAVMDAEFTKIREQYDVALEKCRVTCEKEFEVMQTYCTENKQVLFDKKRSMDTMFGTVGFRLGTPKLKLLPRMKWDSVLDNLMHYLPAYVRTITEPAKDRLLADRALAEVAFFFFFVGLAVDQDERFFVEMKKEEIV